MSNVTNKLKRKNSLENPYHLTRKQKKAFHAKKPKLLVTMKALEKIYNVFRKMDKPTIENINSNDNDNPPSAGAVVCDEPPKNIPPALVAERAYLEEITERETVCV
ncbi:MAG: hypothetical protein FD167_1963 [bacterium]|nr:MAG: hypothetical protein FD167_1963 [bacterium]